MSEDKEEKLSHPIFISAGMAAAGMGPKSVHSKQQKRGVSTGPSETEVEKVEIEEVTGDEQPPEEPEATGPEIIDESTETGGEDEAPEPEVPEPEEPENIETPPKEAAAENLRKVAIIGAEAEDSLREIFSKIDDLEVSTPGDLENFCEFIENEKPELVVVATPGNGDHHELVKAALEADAQVFCTTPFTRTLKEADALVAIAESKALTISIGNALACHPTVLGAFKNRENLIGDLIEMRVFGEMNKHAGGEDLLVNGALLFDVVRMFGGEANWCSAEVIQRGERALPGHIFHSTEANLGQLLGDRIHARFEMDSGIYVDFTSDQRAREVAGPCGIEFIGTKSIMRLQVRGDAPPTLTVLLNPNSHEATRKDKWQEWSRDEEAGGTSPLQDWLAAVDSSSDPACSGLSALKSLEMVHAVWQAGLTGKRAYFPLVNRLHPLNEELL